MYKPGNNMNLRDEVNVAQIANERPCLATRFPCSPDEESATSADTVHGSSDTVAEFNRRLREG